MRINVPKPGFEKLTKEKVRLIGHLIGDGCAYKTKSNYYIRYEVKDVELLDQFEKDLNTIYGLHITRGFNPSGKTGKLIPFVYIRSKLALEDLNKYCHFSSKKWFVPSQILNANKELKVEFLRALFDDEGTVITGRNKEIKLYSINLNGIKQIQKMLIELGIKSRLASGYGSKRNVYGLVIREFKKFDESIGFSLKRKATKLKELV